MAIDLGHRRSLADPSNDLHFVVLRPNGATAETQTGRMRPRSREAWPCAQPQSTSWRRLWLGPYGEPVVYATQQWQTQGTLVNEFSGAPVFDALGFTDTQVRALQYIEDGDDRELRILEASATLRPTPATVASTLVLPDTAIGVRSGNFAPEGDRVCVLTLEDGRPENASLAFPWSEQNLYEVVLREAVRGVSTWTWTEIERTPYVLRCEGAVVGVDSHPTLLSDGSTQDTIEQALVRNTLSGERLLSCGYNSYGALQTMRARGSGSFYEVTNNAAGTIEPSSGQWDQLEDALVELVNSLGNATTLWSWSRTSTLHGSGIAPTRDGRTEEVELVAADAALGMAAGWNLARTYATTADAPPVTSTTFETTVFVSPHAGPAIGIARAGRPTSTLLDSASGGVTVTGRAGQVFDGIFLHPVTNWRDELHHDRRFTRDAYARYLLGESRNMSSPSSTWDTYLSSGGEQRNAPFTANEPVRTLGYALA